jgi:putative ABC transport system ATP-binding protein
MTMTITTAADRAAQIEELHFQYSGGGFSLSIPGLSVRVGEKIGIIGPSGSGKTTLLNLLAGILVPGSGDIAVCGQKVSRLSDAERRRFRIRKIGFVFQDFQLLEYLDILDNILHPYRITPHLALTREVRQKARTLAQSLGMDDKLNRLPQGLSQGERQRAAICRALLPAPGLILADEATGNLDPDNKVKIMELLLNQIDQSGATLVAVTHDTALLDYFDRVIDFNDFRAG